MKRNAGFTLIELVIVIIVLGILAATAVPKFINLQDDAKEAAMKGVESALHSAANIVYSKAAIDGVETKSGENVEDAGTTINTEYGYPAATETGIGASVELSGFGSKYTVVTAPAADTALFWNGTASTGKATCIKYTEATSSARYTIKSDECEDLI
ncbi:type II secretion system protein [Moritella marina ATCC 15381]|uniref:Type II secretion system protein n=1 Tax=Moritella marina ATCC 15381 TaxID=1202962 RepID=A0A5J6WNK8_MORMI|nr:prepilin-type N-terminal cleavage/methylation domain-containing protein [Moritella marina]QFI39739.1 type II secretion system protein [Moritella marina ATCC 15381]